MGLFGRKKKDGGKEDSWEDVFSELRTDPILCRDTKPEIYPSAQAILDDIFESVSRDRPNLNKDDLAESMTRMIMYAAAIRAEAGDGMETSPYHSPHLTMIFTPKLVGDVFNIVRARSDYNVDMLLNGLTYLGPVGWAIASKVISDGGNNDLAQIEQILRKTAADGLIDGEVR